MKMKFKVKKPRSKFLRFIVPIFVGALVGVIAYRKNKHMKYAGGHI